MCDTNSAVACTQPSLQSLNDTIQLQGLQLKALSEQVTSALEAINTIRQAVDNGFASVLAQQKQVLSAVQSSQGKPSTSSAQSPLLLALGQSRTRYPDTATENVDAFGNDRGSAPTSSRPLTSIKGFYGASASHAANDSPGRDLDGPGRGPEVGSLNSGTFGLGGRLWNVAMKASLASKPTASPLRVAASHSGVPAGGASGGSKGPGSGSGPGAAALSRAASSGLGLQKEPEAAAQQERSLSGPPKASSSPRAGRGKSSPFTLLPTIPASTPAGFSAAPSLQQPAAGETAAGVVAASAGGNPGRRSLRSMVIKALIAHQKLPSFLELELGLVQPGLMGLGMVSYHGSRTEASLALVDSGSPHAYATNDLFGSAPDRPSDGNRPSIGRTSAGRTSASSHATFSAVVHPAAAPSPTAAAARATLEGEQKQLSDHASAMPTVIILGQHHEGEPNTQEEQQLGQLRQAQVELSPSQRQQQQQQLQQQAEREQRYIKWHNQTLEWVAPWGDQSAAQGSFLSRSRSLQGWLGACKRAARRAKHIFLDVLDPNDPVRVAWDMLMLTILLYVVLVTPYLVAFEISTGDLSTTMSIMDLTVNSIFMGDVLVTFRTAYPKPTGGLERRRGLIALQYLKFWFWLDTIASIPWDLALGPEAGLIKLLRLTRTARLLRLVSMLRTLRLLRVLKIRSILNHLEDAVGRGRLHIIFFLCVVFTMVHWAACAMYFCAAMDDYGPSSWVVRHGLEERSYGFRYITAVYWAVTTMSTVGYGDIVAYEVAEKIVTMVVMVVGASMFAYMMGAMASIIANSNQLEARVTRKMLAIDSFVRTRRIPPVLASKLRNFYAYRVIREVQDDEREILSGLSDTMQSQFTMYVYKGVLDKVPFFHGKQPRFIRSIVQHLQPRYCALGDVVLYQGEVGTEMFFVVDGSLEARLYDTGNYSLHDEDYGPDPDPDHPDHSPDHSPDHPDPDHPERRSSKVYAGKVPTSGALSASAASHTGGPPAAAHLQHSRLSGGGKMSRAGSRRTASQTSPQREASVRDMLDAGQCALLANVPTLGTINADDPNVDYTVLADYSPGDVFGELACLLGTPHPATVVCAEMCSMYSLSRYNIERVLDRWPHLKVELEDMVVSAAAAQQQQQQQQQEEGERDGAADGERPSYGKQQFRRGSLRRGGKEEGGLTRSSTARGRER